MNEFNPLVEQVARQHRQDRLNEAAHVVHVPWESRRRRLTRQLRAATNRLDN